MQKFPRQFATYLTLILFFTMLIATDAQQKPVAKSQKAASPAEVKSAPVPAKPAPLPEVFDGWELKGAIKTLASAAEVDPTSAAALTEYGFIDGASATYTRSGVTLDLRALRFADVTGTYGAYSFYRQNGWPKEQIGTGAASNHNQVLFWQGNFFVDARFSQMEPTSATSLRDLAAQLLTITGSKAIAPPVLANLPQRYLDGQTTHYALGPASYSNGVLPAALVDFDRGAEVVTANYTLRSGPATLTLIDYPTPQMAAAQEAAISAYIKAGDQPQSHWTPALLNSDKASLEVRRSGPLVAIVSGDAVPDESHRLLETVHFDAALVSIPQPMESDVSKTVQILTGIGIIVGVGGLAAVLLGFFLGGFRALWRVTHGKPASSLADAEFIHLDLRD
jgi:hypothetical protein